MSVAILVDGGFFIKRFPHVYPKVNRDDPSAVVDVFYKMVMKHVKKDDLYRILFYDCAPLGKKSQHPITGNPVDFLKLPGAQFRIAFHDELKKKRKVAIRLGSLQDRQNWIIGPEQTKQLLQKKITVDDLEGWHVTYDIRQKGVDMRVGLDIATLSDSKTVERIILVTADSDMIPAMKHGRKAGIHIVAVQLPIPPAMALRPKFLAHCDFLRTVEWPDGAARIEN